MPKLSQGLKITNLKKQMSHKLQEERKTLDIEHRKGKRKRAQSWQPNWSYDKADQVQCK